MIKEQHTHMHLSILQFKPQMGDFAANTQHILKAAHDAQQQGADLLIASELALSGYPPRDLLFNPNFIKKNHHHLQEICKKTPIPLIVGTIYPLLPNSLHCSNAAVLIDNGQVVACHRKIMLPHDDVFDDTRYFYPGEQPTVVSWKNERLGLTICEDIWDRPETQAYQQSVVQKTMEAGCTLLINLSASPYTHKKAEQRQQLLEKISRQYAVPIIYVNQVGTQDALIFDGDSQAWNPEGKCCFQAPRFQTAQHSLILEKGLLRAPNGNAKTTVLHDDKSTIATCVDALSLALRDYFTQSGLKKLIIGLSGGIDSAVTAALAVHACGADNVIGVSMPSQYTSDASTSDAQALAQNCGFPCFIVPIREAHSLFSTTLEKHYQHPLHDITDQNLQARLRGILLMAFANQYEGLVLATSNKSEIATGYCTLYGDTCGGCAPLGDVYKTKVYQIADYFNQIYPNRIPAHTRTRLPSAELRSEQYDQDSLPDYTVLDDLLEAFLEHNTSSAELIQQGFESHTINQVLQLIYHSEYKRRQMPLVFKVTEKAFGEGRRIPICWVL
jgi:NAD+ synthetase